MNANDLIQLLMLIASTVAIIVSAVMSRESISASMKMVKEQNYIQMFAEYTKRYQEIIMTMPNLKDCSDYLNNHDVQKCMRLYFNLCSEEYDLHCKDAISSDIWQKWLIGMQATMKQKEFLQSWEKQSANYASDFSDFFNDSVVQDNRSNKL